MDIKPDFSSLFYFNPLPSWVYEIETFQILDVNEAAMDHYGYTKEEFLRLTIKDLRPKGEIPKVLAAHNDIGRREGNIYFGIFTHQNKNGRLLRMKINGHKVDYLQKSCMMVVCQDVTEEEYQFKKLKESEEALRQSEAKFRTIFEIASLGIVQVNPSDGQILLVNSYYETITGYTTNELLELSFTELTHPEDRKKDWELFSKALRGEQEYRNEKRYIKKDGTIVWVRVHLAFIKDKLGNPSRTVAICEDITSQKEEEQRLKLLESVITHTKDSILITEAEPFDAPGPRILYVNEAFTKMTGYTPEEVIGKTPRLLQGPKTDQKELERLSRSIRNWEPCEITVINYKKTGEEFWINFSVSPVADENGWYTHWVAIERDVTEQKQKEIKKELLGKISLSFAFENDLTTAVNELCETVTKYGNFDLVELWLPNIQNTQIILMARNSTTSNADVFYKFSKDSQSFAFDEGLPGRVWKQNIPVLWDEIIKKDDFIRKEAAEKAKINSALGIPLLSNSETVGVLVIASQKDAQYLKSYVNLFNELERFIGTEIYRKKLEHDLSHLYDAIPDLVCLADFQGRFLKINKAGCELLGYTEDELLYHSFDEFVHPEDKDLSTNEVMKLGEGENTFNFENRYITKTGDIIWLSWTCNSSTENGLIYATGRNISEEKKLRELNGQASHLARIGSWEVNMVTGKILWSEMVHSLHETEPGSFVPDLESSINFYREDFRQKVRDEVTNCVETGQPFDIEAILVTKNNNELWVRAIGNAEMLHGKCQRIYGSFQDIHERKEAELRLQSLSDNLPGVVFQFFLYPDGTDALRYVTKGAKEIWGFSQGEVIKNNDLVWNQIKAGGDFEQVQQSISESVQSKSKWTARWKYVMPGGGIKTHLGYGSPYFLPDGTVSFNSVILDITQEAKNEELLEQVTEMAKIGSWELDLSHQENDAMYWSPMTREILEVDESYSPSLSGGFEFYHKGSKERIQNAVDMLIKEGKEIDEELLITTSKGNEKWIRCIANSEWVNEKCVKIYGSFQDIHGSKSLEIQIREILGSISDAFYAVDKHWNFTYFNKESEHLLKKTERDVLGKNIWEVFPAAKDTILEQVYREVVQYDKSQYFEYLFPGDNCWYEVNAYPSKGGVSVYFKNIDERKLAAEKLEKAYQEKTNILESVGDAFFALDKDWTVTYWNKRAEEIIGIKREELLGYNLWEKFPLAKDLEFFRQYERAFLEQRPVHFEEYFEPFNQWYEANGYPTPEGISVFFRDITDKKLADQKVLEANERFEKVTDATNDAIWDWDISKGTFYRSNAIDKFFGEDTPKFLNEAAFWQDTFHPEDLAKVKSSLKQSLSDSHCHRWEMEYRIFDKAGGILYVMDRGLILRDNEGKATRMVGAMTDITDRKNYEQHLLELNNSLKNQARDLEMMNEELEQFAYIASHDLQEPLRMVTSFMDQLKRKYENQLDAKALRYIHFASDGAKRMKKIILDLLEYSRAGKFTETKEIVNLNELVENYQTLRRKIIKEKTVEIRTDNLPELVAFKAPLAQTFHCLLDNAIYYSKEGQSPKISISVNSQRDFWEVKMTDKGIGIDPQFHEKIFIMFQRLHNKGQYEGTGIGLSIVKKHVESWGGKIWLESIVGDGTTFYFTIPKPTIEPIIK